MKKNYGIDDYNDFNVLKTPWLLLLITIYLAKYPLLLMVPYIPRVDIGHLETFFSQNITIYNLLSSIPAILLLLVMTAKRKPKAGERARWIWQHGKILLLVSVAIEISTILISILIGFFKLNEVVLIFIYLDFVIVFFLLKSRYIVDLFNSFPD
ncbi:DUF2919 family protein [Candidatus Venteria ishoeyi]|uniref:Uncharacterized protein n=1 Tax=Candidatus Venteria ishoeyi TaxID=1899563 RepID=A0A1H6FB37_9GAMM|nr:DUF2919 family protein [Candidatus Venteria ishoeyi]MDM8546302.1 DUF2919 family protein [Candidatus Venteria ishoeyi]SEH06591.1 Uncharacterised protein [Candidatus Venteria ishoeyi]